MQATRNMGGVFLFFCAHGLTVTEEVSLGGPPHPTLLQIQPERTSKIFYIKNKKLFSGTMFTKTTDLNVNIFL